MLTRQPTGVVASNVGVTSVWKGKLGIRLHVAFLLPEPSRQCPRMPTNDHDHLVADGRPLGPKIRACGFRQTEPSSTCGTSSSPASRPAVRPPKWLPSQGGDRSGSSRAPRRSRQDRRLGPDRQRGVRESGACRCRYLYAGRERGARLLLPDAVDVSGDAYVIDYEPAIDAIRRALDI